MHAAKDALAPAAKRRVTLPANVVGENARRIEPRLAARGTPAPRGA